MFSASALTANGEERKHKTIRNPEERRDKICFPRGYSSPQGQYVGLKYIQPLTLGKFISDGLLQLIAKVMPVFCKTPIPYRKFLF